MQNDQTINQIQPAAVEKICGSCHFRAETAEDACPRCYKAMFAPSHIRLSGAMYVFGGLLNVVLMLIMISVANARRAAKPEIEVDAFAFQAATGVLMAFAACGFVWIVFGLLQLHKTRMYSRVMWMVNGAVWLVLIASEMMMLLWNR